MLLPAQTTKNKYTQTIIYHQNFPLRTHSPEAQTLTIKRHYTEQEVAIIHFSHNGYTTT